MNRYVSPNYCIPFANGECASGETCPLRHDIFKCSCGHILRLVVQEQHKNSKKHSQNLAALQSHPETGDSSSSPPISTFCVGYAPTARGKCQGQSNCPSSVISRQLISILIGAKPCSGEFFFSFSGIVDLILAGTIIPKGGLQFGVFVDTSRYTFLQVMCFSLCNVR